MIKLSEVLKLKEQFYSAYKNLKLFEEEKINKKDNKLNEHELPIIVYAKQDNQGERK